MERIISFGKIAYDSNIKENEVTVIVRLLNIDGKKVFNVVGNIWNKKKSDILSGGQNLDIIKKYIKSPLFHRIYVLWIKYNNNDLHHGTEKQEQAINGFITKDYSKICEYLKNINLYEDNGYIYGSGFLYRPIPDKDLMKIKKIINNL